MDYVPFYKKNKAETQAVIYKVWENYTDQGNLAVKKAVN